MAEEMIAKEYKKIKRIKSGSDPFFEPLTIFGIMMVPMKKAKTAIKTIFRPTGFRSNNATFFSRKSFFPSFAGKDHCNDGGDAAAKEYIQGNQKTAIAASRMEKQHRYAIGQSHASKRIQERKGESSLCGASVGEAPDPG